MKVALRWRIFASVCFLVLAGGGIGWGIFSRLPDNNFRWLIFLASELLLAAVCAYFFNRFLIKAGAGGHIDFSDDDCRRLVYVGADSFREGRTCGELMGQALQGQGRVLIVTGLTGQGLEIRKAGFMAVLDEKYPGIQVVLEIEGRGKSENVYQQVVSAFQRNLDLTGIYVVDGNTPQVVVRALKDAGKARRVKVICHDMVEQTMQALADGVVTATISQDPFAQGHDPIIYLFNYLAAGQRPPRPKMTTQMERITCENYLEHWDPKRGTIESETSRARRVRPVNRQPGKRLRIVVLGREDITFFTPVKQGALAAAQELKAYNTEVEWVEPESARRRQAYDAADYGPAIEDYRAKKYDAIVVPVYDKALVPYINRAVDAGIPVAVYNSEPDTMRGLMNTLITQSQELRDISFALARSAAETGERADQINNAIGEMNQALTAEAQSAQQAIENTRQMAKAISSINHGASEQTQAASNVSQAIDEISRAITGTNRTALVSEKTAEQAVSTARKGAQTIQQTLGQITEISKAVNASADKIHALNKLSRQIDVIVSTVADIAEQTNMLALNANIEAARAGENGRGFAVVATEIRNLAEISKRSTKEIAGLIRSIQGNSADMVVSADIATQQAQAGGELAAQAGQALDDLLKAAETMRTQTENVVRANESVVQALERLNQANQRVVGVINENAGATRQVTENIEQTVQMVNHMSGISSENARAIEFIHAGSNEFAAQSQQLRTSIAALAQMAEEMQGAVAAYHIRQAGD